MGYTYENYYLKMRKKKRRSKTLDVQSCKMKKKLKKLIGNILPHRRLHIEHRSAHHNDGHSIFCRLCKSTANLPAPLCMFRTRNSLDASVYLFPYGLQISRSLHYTTSLCNAHKPVQWVRT